MLTHAGAKAAVLSTEDQLRRSVLNCLLWENTFYENGISIKDRISSLSKECDPKVVSYLAIEARTKYKLRSVPLLLAKELSAKGGSLVSYTLENIIKRPDELSKFMSLYWENGKTPISKQVKKGLSKAFQKFNEYQLAKWNNNDTISLRDVMFLVHPKPLNEQMEKLWYKLANNELDTPYTWEVGLSKCKYDSEKRQVWEDLLQSNKLGALALLKNIRGMYSVGVNVELIKEALVKINVENVLPYRFVTTSKFVERELIPYLQKAMFKCIENKQKLQGKTVLLVDVSGSMDYVNQQSNSKTSRLDIGIGLSILLKQLCDDIKIYSFSDELVYIRTKNTNGFELYDKISGSQRHNGTQLGRSLYKAQLENTDCDRIIVITDEQSHDNIKQNNTKQNTYIMNVAPYKNGIEFNNDRLFRINGFSENVVDYIFELEKPLIDWSSELDNLFKIDWMCK